MRHSVLIGIALASVAFSGTALSSEQSAPVAEAPKLEAKADEKEQLICRREKVTGSRFARNLCHTREQWEAMRKAGVEGTKSIQRAPVPLVSE